MFGSVYFCSEQLGSERLVSVDSGIVPSGIVSVSAFGTPALTLGAISLSPTGISSNSAFGTATVTVNGVTTTITVTGIASSSAFGTATITLPQILSLSGIPSLESFGSQTLHIFSGSFNPVDPLTDTVWVGYDESQDLATIYPSNINPTGVWISDDAVVTSTHSATNTGESASWVAN